MSQCSIGGSLVDVSVRRFDDEYDNDYCHTLEIRVRSDNHSTTISLGEVCKSELIDLSEVLRKLADETIGLR